MPPNFMQPRLDASESVYFQRELEIVDARLYEVKYASLQARSLIPTQPGIPEWAKVYVWRETDMVGTAKYIGNMADDLPMSNVLGAENTKIIKPCGGAYGYDLFEIRASAALGTSLDVMRATACRRSVEQLVDTTLATGSAAHNLQGLLNLANVPTFTPGTKTGGGLTWGTLTALNATADEMALDLMGIASARHEATKGLYGKFTIILPLVQYNVAAQVRMGDASDMTVLQFVLKTSPYIEAIVPWHLATGAGAGSTDRMVCYPRDLEVLAGLVPMDFSPQPVERKNLKFVINCLASCGGVILRYPVAMAYGDGI